MAEDRYPKEDILNVPYLAPERDYRSEGNSEEHVNYPTPDKPNRTLETLDNLDGVIRMADLLPAELGAIIKDITNDSGDVFQDMAVLHKIDFIEYINISRVNRKQIHKFIHAGRHATVKAGELLEVIPDQRLLFRILLQNPF